MKKMRNLLVLAICLLLSGCSSGQIQIPQVETMAVSEKTETYDAMLADSLDEAVVISIDKEKELLKLFNLQKGKTYCLTYTGATTVQNKNGKELVMEQIPQGALVTVAFVREKKAAKAVFLKEDAVAYTDVTVFEINKTARTMEFEGQQYQLAANLAVIGEGTLLELMDINAVDTLTVNAVGHTVYSIEISKGHGYLRLLNYEFFVGGWIEVGQSLIKPVIDGMLLTVPEGSYTMLISKQGVGGTKEIEIIKGEELEVDVSDLRGEIDETEKGKIIFTITPSEAVLEIDGNQMDYSKEIELPYGVHQMVCKASGYATLKQYFKVNQSLANINIELKPASGVSLNEDDTVSGNTVSGNTASGNTMLSESDYQVHVDAPVGAELYLDGKYIGIIPTSFSKKQGSYTISVRKSGYHTRSYSMQIDNELKDVTYSFAELLPVNTGE